MFRLNRTFTILLLVALILSACQPIVAPAQPMGEQPSQLPDEVIAAIRQLVDQRMAESQIPGFSVAVVKDGALVYAEGFGLTELGTERAVTPETVFQLASTSKRITATAIMQLVEQGKLRLADRVVDHLPYFQMVDERYRDITIEELLTHRSGLPEGFGFLGAEEIAPSEYDAGAAERLVRSLAETELLFAPGEEWSYSDLGYDVLGDVIAKVSGMSFEDYVQQQILTPLGMTHSTFLLDEVPAELLAAPHVENEQGAKVVSSIMPYSRQHAPSDNLFSNVIDMSRLALASLNHGELDGHRIVSEASWEQMWSVQSPTSFGDFLDSLATDYGYGWYIGQVAGHRVVHHPGNELGYTDQFLLAPDDDLAVITMGNSLGPDEDILVSILLASDILELFFEPAPAAAYTPRFEPAECKYPIPEGDQVECGYLIVPEDRSRPDGPMIRVQVVNFKSRSANPEPDPIILVPGGPGAGRGIYIYLWTAAPVAGVMRADRDVLMIEHRGANYAEPAFYCPEMEADLADLSGMSYSEEIAWSGAAYQACSERLAQEGHNLSLYGPVDAATDIADLRVALGYDQVNVYGVSYGTLPALDLMRDHPEGIRSVILDSIQPPEVNVTAGMLEVTQGMHQAIFRACASDPVCDEAYPNLEQVFYDLLAQLRANPVTVTVSDEAGQSYSVTVDDLKFLQFVNNSGFAGEDFTQLPSVIYTAAQGDLSPAAQGWLAYLSGRHGPAAPGTGAWSMGSFYSVTCLQDGSMGDVAQAKTVYATRGGNPSVLDWTEHAFIQEWLGPCAYWPVTPPQPNLAIEPVVSDIPTLMMVNTFDIFYAPGWATPVAERLSHSHLYEFPRGHASILSACPLEMLDQFLADPTQAPDSSCIDEMELNWVLPE